MIEKFLNQKELEGWELAKGMLSFVVFMYLIGYIILTVQLRFITPIDDSDQSRGNRSGLKIHTDYKTGIQYLSDGHGGLVKRAN